MDTQTPTTPTLLDIARARIRQGNVSERELQQLLGLTPSKARRLTDELVNEGFAYRCDRLLVLNEVRITCQHDTSIIPQIMSTLERGPNTISTMSRLMRVQADVLLATMEHLRAEGQVSGQPLGALMIYRSLAQEAQRAM